MSTAKRDYKRDLLNQIHFLKLPVPVAEFKFALPRQWRFDFCWPDLRVAVEYNGIFGAKTISHGSMAGLNRDYEKLNEANLLGWTVLVVTARTVDNGQAIDWILKAHGREEIK